MLDVCDSDFDYNSNSRIFHDVANKQHRLSIFTGVTCANSICVLFFSEQI